MTYRYNLGHFRLKSIKKLTNVINIAAKQFTSNDCREKYSYTEMQCTAVLNELKLTIPRRYTKY